MNAQEHIYFPPELLDQLEEFCANSRTGKIEIDIRNGQVMTVKSTETLFDSNRIDKARTPMKQSSG